MSNAIRVSPRGGRVVVLAEPSTYGRVRLSVRDEGPGIADKGYAAPMATLSELSLPVRAFLKTYRWRRIDPVPWAPLRRPLSGSRLALVSSAGLVLPDQEPFASNLAGGDGSFREIPSDADLSTLIDCHKSKSFDHEGMHSDPNLALPLDRARELVERGRVGSLSARHLSFMGSITAPGRLVRDHAPQAARRLVEDGVDVALLVPV